MKREECVYIWHFVGMMQSPSQVSSLSINTQLQLLENEPSIVSMKITEFGGCVCDDDDDPSCDYSFACFVLSVPCPRPSSPSLAHDQV